MSITALGNPPSTGCVSDGTHGSLTDCSRTLRSLQLAKRKGSGLIFGSYCNLIRRPRSGPVALYPGARVIWSKLQNVRPETSSLPRASSSCWPRPFVPPAWSTDRYPVWLGRLLLACHSSAEEPAFSTWQLSKTRLPKPFPSLLRTKALFNPPP